MSAIKYQLRNKKIICTTGYYYMTMILAEYRYNGQYETMDYVNYQRQERF